MGTIGEWQRGAVIGRGASATVSIAAVRTTGQVFAVKSVEIARAEVLKREQSVLSALSASPYVVSCLGSDVSVAADGSGARFDLFLEYAPCGSLADEIKRRGGRCEEAVIRARAGDVLRGLAHVHGAGFAHCDVKGRNVLLGADGCAMLADFGCARWTGGSNNAGGGAAVRGTPVFMAPEAARGEAQGAAADVWALGCTVIEMATGAAPWPHRFADPVAALHHVAHSGEVPEPPAWLSDEGKDFLSRCLVRDPAARWTAEQLLQHPFVASATVVDPSSVAKGSAIEPTRVSPKSILDQELWEQSEPDSSATTTTTTVTTLTTPADRIRALAGDVAPDWTWTGGEEHWITVLATDTPASHQGLDASAPSKLDADATTAVPTGASEDPHIGEHMGADAAASSRGREDSGGARSSAGSPRGDSVVGSVSNSSSDESCCSSGNSASSSNNDRNKGVINLRILPTPPVRAGSRFFTFPARALSFTFPSRARREP